MTASAAPVIRDARAGDAERIAALWNPWITDSAITFTSEPRRPEEIAALIAGRQSAGHAFLIAEGPDGVLSGFAGYGQFRPGPGYAHTMEHTVILSPQARGSGLGRALLTRIEAHARAGGARLMIAAVSGENPSARAFHEALGYRLCGTLPGAGFKFGRALDLWLLSRDL